MSEAVLSITQTLTRELSINANQVEATIRLLDDGATVPFIARYRKEATNGLNDTALRLLSDRLYYLRALGERRDTILQSIREQDKLSPALEKDILAADTKTRLEDLYLPYRPKRRTKASLAKEAGLEPLAAALRADLTLVPIEAAASFVNSDLGILQAEAALEGAQQILMEQFAEEPNFLEALRQASWQQGVLKSVKAKEKTASSKQKKAENNKFVDYYEYAEPIKKIPSHRALALFRGRREGLLQLSITLLDDPNEGINRVVTYFNLQDVGFVEGTIALRAVSPATQWLLETAKLAWTVKIAPKLEVELLARLRELADEEAIRVFATNLRDLLLAPPAGPQVTIGLDPGIRTGVKVTVIDETSKLLDYCILYPLAPQNEWHESIAALAKLAVKYHAKLISMGNGTGSRETERLVSELIKMYPDLNLTKVMVSEAGASVYSASELAAKELPDLDVSLRGAVSIARRLQDPLPELVKIDPKSIGVGQYQHDVNQTRLARALDAVVEDCVNAVGVDLNLASKALLQQVSGLNETLANSIVQYRDEHGAFKNRQALKNVPRLGEKAFQQSAGFLRIRQGDNPLDASGVHPESYPLVEQLLADNGVPIDQLIGQSSLLQHIDPNQYVNEQYGLPTVQDVLRELDKPGRDPRPAFKVAQFKEGIEDIKDLQVGMELEGVVSNVTNFGAFVDIGVHQDGLVHISNMTNRFIRDPHAIVKAGDIVQVKVIEVDKERRRIGLTMNIRAEKPLAPEDSQSLSRQKPVRQSERHDPAKNEPRKSKSDKPIASSKKPNAFKQPVFNTAMADALLKLKRGESNRTT